MYFKKRIKLYPLAYTFCVNLAFLEKVYEISLMAIVKAAPKFLLIDVSQFGLLKK